MKKFYSLILLLSLGVLTFGQTTIWSEDFESYATNTGVDGDGNSGDYPASVSKWSLDVLGAGMDNDEDWFYTNTAASSCQMQARDVGGIVIFISETINISTYTNVSISLDVSADGGMESTDYAKASYKIDGGSITQFGYANDDFTSTTFSVSALSGSSLIIYVELKNGAADEYHQFDNMLVTGTSTSIDPEPSNPISSFSAVANGSGQIDLSWNDNDGAQVAAGVLIRANLNGTFSDPVDGTAEADDTNMTDGQGLVNIAHGVQAYSFTGLSPNTTYYFKAFTYTNSGVNINYKTDGTPSTTNATTEAATGETLIISEVADPNDDYSARFVELYNAGASTIDFDTETWYLCFQANGGNFTNKQLSGKIYPGETYVTSYSISAFPANYSFVSDFQTGFNGSGDDGYFLYKNGDQTSGSLIDAYGVLDEDGTGKTWEYTNKQAKRKNGILNANSTWTASEWDIVSANVADMNPGSHLLCVGWNGKSSTDWNTTANWSGELAPTSSNHVKIPTGCTYYPTLNTDKSIQNLFVKSKQSSTASIIEAGHLSINQNVYAERYMEDYSSTSNGWHFLSSPLANFLIAGSDFAPEAGVDDLFRFGESNNSWLNYTGGSFGQTQLETGLGYLVSYSSQSTKTFNGSTLAGSSSISKNLSYTSGVGNGWNLLGNPYLSAIDWDDITKTSQIHGTIYVIKADDGEYISYNGSTGDISAGEIPAMQAFFVKADAAGQSISMEYADQKHSSNEFWKETQKSIETLKLSLKTDTSENNTYFQFREDATGGFDSHCDGYKLYGYGTIPLIYSQWNQLRYSINCLPYSTETISVPLGIQIIANGTLSIDFSGLDSFEESVSIHLEDLQTGQTSDIKQNPTYSFEANTNQAALRFVLHFNGVDALEELLETAPNVFAYEQAIYIESPEALKGKVQIYSVNGQLLYNKDQHLTSFQKIPIKLSTGVYLVKITGANKIWNTKVFVK